MYNALVFSFIARKNAIVEISRPLEGMSFYFDTTISTKEQKETEEKIKFLGGVRNKTVTRFQQRCSWQ